MNSDQRLARPRSAAADRLDDVPLYSRKYARENVLGMLNASTTGRLAITRSPSSNCSRNNASTRGPKRALETTTLLSDVSVSFTETWGATTNSNHNTSRSLVLPSSPAATSGATRCDSAASKLNSSSPYPTAATWSSRVDLVRQRRAQHTAEVLTEIWDDFVDHDDRRLHSLDAVKERSLELRRQKWVVTMCHAVLVSMLQHQVCLRRALEVLRRHFLYRYLHYVRKKRAVRERRIKLQQREHGMKAPPSREVLRAASAVFHMLPDHTLDALAAAMKRKCLFGGEFVAYEGEPGDVALIFHRGHIAVSRRSTSAAALAPGVHGTNNTTTNGGGNTNSNANSIPSTPLRRRQSRTSTATTTGDALASAVLSAAGGAGDTSIPQTDLAASSVNQPGWTIGQTMLLTQEPYEWSFRATEDTDLWQLTSQQFLEIAQNTMAISVPKQLEALYRVMDERRARNMQRLGCITDAALRICSPLFREISDAGVRKILRMLQPLVVRKGDMVLRPGTFGSHAILVVGGRLEVVCGSKSEIAKVGACVGEGTAAFSSRPPDDKTFVRAATNAELWLLEKSDLQNILLHEESRVVMAAMVQLIDDHGRERLFPSSSATAHNGQLSSGW